MNGPQFRWRAYRWLWRQKMLVPRSVPANSAAENVWIIIELRYHRPGRSASRVKIVP